MLVPLSVFFAVPGNKEAAYSAEQTNHIESWFWRSAFSRRYSSAVLRTLNADITMMKNLRTGTFAHTVAPYEVEGTHFASTTFGMGNVDTKTFILMLAKAHPRSFVSGAPVDLEETLMRSNRTEFHHLMPRAFLRASHQSSFSDSCLANFAFLSRADNRTIGGSAPSQYRHKLPDNVDEILKCALCPPSLFQDWYEDFVIERSELLAGFANALCS
jgi:hypothetical protein